MAPAILLAVLALSSIIAIAACPAPGEAPPPPGLPGTILVLRGRTILVPGAPELLAATRWGALVAGAGDRGGTIVLLSWSGVPAWSRNMSWRPLAAAEARGGIAVLGPGVLVLLSPSDGHPVAAAGLEREGWSIALERLGPGGLAGVVWAREGNTSVGLFNASTGELLVETGCGGGQPIALAVGDGRAVTITERSIRDGDREYVACTAATSGSIVVRLLASQENLSASLSPGGGAAALYGEGTVYIVDTTTGRLLASRSLGGASVESAYWSPDSRWIVVEAGNETLILDATDASTVYAAGQRLAAPPAWGPGAVALPLENGRLEAVALPGGRPLLSEEREGRLGPVVWAGDALYASWVEQSAYPRIVAYRLAGASLRPDGASLVFHASPLEFMAPGPSGVLAVATRDGYAMILEPVTPTVLYRDSDEIVAAAIPGGAPAIGDRIAAPLMGGAASVSLRYRATAGIVWSWALAPLPNGSLTWVRGPQIYGAIMLFGSNATAERGGIAVRAGLRVGYPVDVQVIAFQASQASPEPVLAQGRSAFNVTFIFNGKGEEWARGVAVAGLDYAGPTVESVLGAISPETAAWNTSAPPTRNTATTRPPPPPLPPAGPPPSTAGGGAWRARALLAVAAALPVALLLGALWRRRRG